MYIIYIDICHDTHIFILMVNTWCDNSHYKSDRLSNKNLSTKHGKSF